MFKIMKSSPDLVLTHVIYTHYTGERDQ